MGLSLSRVHHAIFVVLCCFILCSTRAASILSSRPHITVAVAHSDGHGRRLYGAFLVKGASRHFCRKTVRDQQEAPLTMTEATLFLPGLSPVGGKTISATFDGGQLSSNGGVLT